MVAETSDIAAGEDLSGSRHGFAMLLMVISSLVISFAGVVVRSIETTDTWKIIFYRAATLLGAVIIILLIQHGRQTLAQVRNIGKAGLLGGVCLGIAGVAYVLSITTTTVANTLFMLSSIPFITALLARIFLKEYLKRATLVTMVAAAIGVSVMISDGFAIGSTYGNIMALVTAVCFSAYAVIVHKHRRIDMLPTLLISSLGAVVVSLALSFENLGISLNDLALCFLWGAGLSGVANWLFIIASRYLMAAEVTLIMLLEFSLGPVWVWIVIGETPTQMTIIGGVLVIGAVACRAVIQLLRARHWKSRTGFIPPT